MQIIEKNEAREGRPLLLCPVVEVEGETFGRAASAFSRRYARDGEKVRSEISGSVGIGFRVVIGVGQAAEEPPPLAGNAGAAELGEAGDELVPGQDGQAGVSLKDRHDRAVVVDGQDGDGLVFWVLA